MDVIPIQVIQQEVIIPLTYFPESSELELIVRGGVAVVRPKTVTRGSSPEWSDAEIEAERAAFLRLHPDLWEKYPEQYVAILGGKVVDHDADKVALFKRIDARYPGVFVLMRQVRQEAEIVYRNHSARWVKD